MLALAGAAFGSHAATIEVVNGDPANVGFNDPTPVPPIIGNPGNPGTTLGAQRMNVYLAVAKQWGDALTSSVPIVVYATWEPLACDESSGVLGSAGTIFINSNFTSAPFTDTWYNSALANKIAGSDLIGPDATASDPAVRAGADIRARFNVNLGTPGCLEDSPFYLGLDNQGGSDAVDFYSVLLHELGHGLGFQVITDAKSGRRVGNPALPSVWERFMLDNDTGLTWFQMSMRERKLSALNFRGLVWNGAAVTAQSANVLTYGTAEAVFNTLPPQTFAVGTAEYGPPLTEAGITAIPATINRQRGEVGPGCSPYDAGNAAAVVGRIALVDRGGCTFVIKSTNAQNAGAIAVVIVNNVAGGPISPAGSGTFLIPTVGISKDDGATIKSALRRNSPTLTLRLNTSLLAGADANKRVFLYTPDAFEGGSSVSHWDTSATRNLLMEPFINSDLDHSIGAPNDLTLQLFIDIGW
jgi:hypothetical protein